MSKDEWIRTREKLLEEFCENVIPDGMEDDTEEIFEEFFDWETQEDLITDEISAYADYVYECMKDEAMEI